MLNNRFRTSLTRDEIVAILLGWLKEPYICCAFEDATPEERELIDAERYCLLLDREDREADVWEKHAECRESGQPVEICRQFIDDFKREEEALKRFCYEVDDEISKGPNSMLRVDRRSSTPRDTCYTRKSFDEWVSERPGLLTNIPKVARDQTPNLSKGEQQEEAILACIRERGYIATSLERPKAGLKGIKSEVRAMLVGTPPFSSQKTFDNAWQRLRDSTKICEAAPSPTTALPK